MVRGPAGPQTKDFLGLVALARTPEPGKCLVWGARRPQTREFPCLEPWPEPSKNGVPKGSLAKNFRASFPVF